MNQIFRTFLFFYHEHRFNTILVIFLLILSGIAEAIGVTAFLPFLQIVLEGGSSVESLPDGIIKDFIEWSGVPLTFTAMATFIAVSLLIKASILLTAITITSRIIAKVSANLRIKLIETLLQAQWKYFVTSIIGANLNSLISETDRSSRVFISMANFIASIVQVLVYLGAAFLISWKVAFFGIFIGLSMMGALWFLVKKARQAGSNQTIASQMMLGQMGDVIQGIKPTRAMGLEKKFSSMLKSYSKDLEQAQATKLTSTQAMVICYEPIMVLAALLGLFIVFSVGNLAISEVALMGIIFIRIMMGLNRTQNYIQSYMSEESALASLLKTLNKIEQHAEKWELDVSTPPKIQKISFSKVSFSYGEKQVLNNINLDIAPKKMTALIGSSGSGKTTLLDLLCGFYQPNEGSIYINETSFNKVDLKEWRRNIGFVPQEVFLFNDSIKANILMGREGYSDDAIWAALEAVEMLEFVKDQSEKLDFLVGEQGRKLSGGQRQRIAIARAILHNPQILLLDEATSALDGRTENSILVTLKKLSQSVTIIMSSHHDAVTDFADTVFNLEHGKIVKSI